MRVAVGRGRLLLHRMECHAIAYVDRFPGLAKTVGGIFARIQQVSICFTLALLANRPARFADVELAHKQLQVGCSYDLFSSPTLKP